MFITVWTVVHTVLTVTFNSYGDRQISTPYKINTPEPIDKKFGTIDYVREGTSYTKFGRNPSTGASGQMGEIYIFFIPFFFDQPAGHRQTRGWIFTHSSSKDVKSRKDVPFVGLNYVPPNFGGITSQKLKFFWAWIRLSSLNDKKIKILTTWKLLSRSWRNFYRKYAPWMGLRGWSHGSPNQIQDGGSRHL